MHSVIVNKNIQDINQMAIEKGLYKLFINKIQKRRFADNKPKIFSFFYSSKRHHYFLKTKISR